MRTASALSALLMCVLIGACDSKHDAAKSDASADKSARGKDGAKDGGPRSAEAGFAAPAEPRVAADGAPGGEGPLAPATEVRAERKIIYTADVTVTTDDFAKAETGVSKLVKAHGGYVFQSDVAHPRGGRRSGRWSIRIPVLNFHKFLEQVGDLGVPDSLKTNAQDVTEEFFDLEARISTKKKLEARVTELLKTREARNELREVLELERELNRIRGEIERMEGRRNFLAGMSALSTVNLTVQEKSDDYQPQQAGPQDFGARVSGAWNESLHRLQRFGASAAVIAVSVAPWTPLILVGLWVGVRLVRRAMRRAPSA